MSRLASLLTSLWSKLGLLAAAAVAIAWTVATLRRSGRDAERAERRGEILDAVERRHEVDADVARDPDPAGRLRERWSRD